MKEVSDFWLLPLGSVKFHSWVINTICSKCLYFAFRYDVMLMCFFKALIGYFHIFFRAIFFHNTPSVLSGHHTISLEACFKCIWLQGSLKWRARKCPKDTILFGCTQGLMSAISVLQAEAVPQMVEGTMLSSSVR